MLNNSNNSLIRRAVQNEIMEIVDIHLTTDFWCSTYVYRLEPVYDSIVAVVYQQVLYEYEIN